MHRIATGTGLWVATSARCSGRGLIDDIGADRAQGTVDRRVFQAAARDTGQGQGSAFGTLELGVSQGAEGKGVLAGGQDHSDSRGGDARIGIGHDIAEAHLGVASGHISAVNAGSTGDSRAAVTQGQCQGCRSGWHIDGIAGGGALVDGRSVIAESDLGLGVVVDDRGSHAGAGSDHRLQVTVGAIGHTGDGQRGGCRTLGVGIVDPIAVVGIPDVDGVVHRCLAGLDGHGIAIGKRQYQVGLWCIGDADGVRQRAAFGHATGRRGDAHLGRIDRVGDQGDCGSSVWRDHQTLATRSAGHGHRDGVRIDVSVIGVGKRDIDRARQLSGGDDDRLAVGQGDGQRTGRRLGQGCGVSHHTAGFSDGIGGRQGQRRGPQWDSPIVAIGGEGVAIVQASRVVTDGGLHRLARGIEHHE